MDEILRSGFPGLRELDGRPLRAQLDGYLRRVVDRDFPQLGQPVRKPDALRRWMTAYAAATATTTSFEKIRDASTSGRVSRLAPILAGVKHNRAGGGRLLRSSAQLAAVGLVSAVVGVALGVGLSKLSGDDDASGQTSLASTTTTRGSQTGSATKTSTTAASGANDEDPLKKVRVSIRSAVLNTAATPAGMLRNRARLSVRVKIHNRSQERVTIPRPTLLVAGRRLRTDPPSDSPDTRVEELASSRSATVTLIFETAGTVTEALTTQRSARIVVAGRSRSVSIKVGDAVPAPDSGTG